MDLLIEPPTLPAWLRQADVTFFVEEFRRTGFTGGLNWYRTIDLNWELMAPWQGARVVPPALYIAGEWDHVGTFPGMNELIPGVRAFVPN